MLVVKIDCVMRNCSINGKLFCFSFLFNFSERKNILQLSVQLPCHTTYVEILPNTTEN